MPAGWNYQKSKAYFAVIQLWWRTLGVRYITEPVMPIQLQ